MHKTIRKRLLRYLKERGIYKPYLTYSCRGNWKEKFSRLWHKNEDETLICDYNRFSELICISFPWSSTKEGTSFWANENSVLKTFIYSGGFANGFRTELMEHINRQVPLRKCERGN